MNKTHKNIRIAGVLAALADPVRVRIIRILELANVKGRELAASKGHEREIEELTVGEVASVVQLPQSTVSRHLKVLADAGWVSRRPSGTATLYHIILDDLSVPARGVWVAVRDEIERGSESRADAQRLKDVLAERRLDSAAFFGRVAGEWDEVRERLFGNDFTARALLGLLPREWVVADIGCGTGNASELLAPHVKRVVAVDASEPMLEAARKRLAGTANVEFRNGRLEELPLKDASVDAAACVLVLHHVREPEGALAEMRRVVRPGGVALVVDMLEHDREEYRQQMGHIHLGFAPEQVRRMMRDAGFATIEVGPLPMASAAKGPGLFVATGRTKN